MSVGYWGLLFVGIMLSSIGGILFKMASVEIMHGGFMQIILQSIVNVKIILGIVFYMVPACIWIFMLKKIDISYLQPMFSLVYVVTPVLALAILHEKIPLNRWAGILVIVIGVIIVARR
jgi:drug/metabolite transporter (DMT)-like permease